MVTNLKITVSIFILLTLPIALFAQKDVTQFLGIPIDGYKPEMINKLKDKGYTISPYSNDLLDGEFNGTMVNIIIVTNNNKVCRIAVADVNTLNEADIRNRYNNLLQQFQNNKKYLSLPDSTILKYTIPEDEDISYELSVNNKPYQAVFYQKTVAYDSLTLEKDILMAKRPLTAPDIEQVAMLMAGIKDELYKCFNKLVWIKLSERYGKYYITMFYDNEYNRANGESL